MNGKPNETWRMR